MCCNVSENDLVEIGDGRFVTRMRKTELQKFAAEAIDSFSLVSFRLFASETAFDRPAKLPRAEAILLGLHAGANVVDPDWVDALSQPCECAGPDVGADVLFGDEDEERAVKIGDVVLVRLRPNTTSWTRNLINDITPKVHMPNDHVLPPNLYYND